MSQRAVWVVSFSKGGGTLLCTRSFPTVEMVAKDLEGSDYVELPSAESFVQSLSDSLGLSADSNDFNKARDSCQAQDQKPVFELVTGNGSLWPLLVMEHNGLLFCTLPLVDEATKNKSHPPLIKIPGIVTGYALLQGMADFVGSIPKNADSSHEKFADLYLYLGEAAPFGRPTDVNVQNIKIVFQSQTSKGTRVETNEVQPAWKPETHKGNQCIRFKVTEQIKAVQFDSQSIPDEMETSGSVRCKADLHGNMPDVSVIVGYRSEGSNIQMNSLITHPCVQSADTQIIDSSPGVNPKPIPRKLKFTPPLDSFTLCHYTTKDSCELPIKGAYQMKGEKIVDCLVQLQLSKKVKNNFEYCELQLPFYHRGQIVKVDSNKSHGTVLLSPDKRKLVWNIGKKFPGKDLEIILKATVQFGYYDTRKHPKDDQFCSGNNSYALIFFKLVEYIHSGIQIDSKSVQISSAAPCNVVAEYEYITKDYKIWNTHGDSLHSFVPPRELLSDK